MIVCTGSFKPGYLTYCAESRRCLAQFLLCRLHCRAQFQTRLSHILCRLAAISNLQQLLSPVPRQPNACCSEAGGQSAKPAAPLSSHCSKSAADAQLCLPPARHRRRGLEIKPICTAFPAAFMAFHIAFHIAWHIAWHIAC